MPKRFPNQLINLLGGFAIGICISLWGGVLLLYYDTGETTRINTPQPSDEMHFFETPTLEMLTQEEKLLEEAELALESGETTKVNELLFPIIETWKSTDDLAQGYKLLGHAEVAQGHPQLAVPYFEKLYFYQPTPENLLILAITYDMGGDIRNAIEKYQNLANWEDLPPEIDIEFINMRIQDISHSLGTPVPATPTPP